MKRYNIHPGARWLLEGKPYTPSHQTNILKTLLAAGWTPPSGNLPILSSYDYNDPRNFGTPSVNAQQLGARSELGRHGGRYKGSDRGGARGQSDSGGAPERLARV